jgi:hypothetical protein
MEMRVAALGSALVALAGCWQTVVVQAPPQPIVEQPSPSLVPRRPHHVSPYREVAGTWVGTGYQYDLKSTWPIQMTLFARGEVGDVIGVLSYPSLNCTAELIRQPERGDVLAMTEKLTTGQGKCVDNGTIRIPRRPTARELDWKWDFANGQEGASSVLKRDD